MLDKNDLIVAKNAQNCKNLMYYQREMDNNLTTLYNDISDLWDAITSDGANSALSCKSAIEIDIYRMRARLCAIEDELQKIDTFEIDKKNDLTGAENGQF